MVAGVVHTSAEINCSVTVRIEYALILVDKFLFEVRTDVHVLLFIYDLQRLKRDVVVLNVTVTAPFKISVCYSRTALVSVVECKGILESLCEVYFNVINVERGRVRHILACYRRRIFTGRCVYRLKCKSGSHGKTEEHSQYTVKLFHKFILSVKRVTPDYRGNPHYNYLFVQLPLQLLFIRTKLCDLL